MADKGYILGLLSGVPDAVTKRILKTCFEHTYDNWRFGEPTDQARATNFQAYFYSSTTPTSTGEFSIAHGLGRTPNLAIPIYDVKQEGATLPILTVSRAADSVRVYFKAASGSTSMAFKFLLE